MPSDDRKDEFVVRLRSALQFYPVQERTEEVTQL